MASICGSPVCAGGKPKMKFTYTGDYVVRKDGVVELLTSGTIVFLEPKVIDVFMVGGGGAGSTFRDYDTGGYGGGGGGYTRTVRKFNAAANTNYTVTVGTGAVYSAASKGAPAGGSSAFGSFTVQGGGAVGEANRGGRPGGSGGGGGTTSNSDGGAGGYDGGNGERGGNNGHVGGVGQGFTTREFGEAAGKLYAGGGGGGRYMAGNTPVISLGGSGGGGSGGWINANGANKQEPAAGVANTGGGGGGGAGGGAMFTGAGSGGSGIVCFRESVELPELAGTWVLNERLYAPETVIIETIRFVAGATITSINNPYKEIRIGYNDIMYYVETSGGTPWIFNFKTPAWNASYKYKYLKFPTGATASNEFRTWLASNATKQ